MGVPTPTGVLEGVAAFGWDGSQWQPSGRAAYGVGTPTGVLRGVAPFTWNGSAWAPVGQAGPGVATPSGVLQGVAVYTWNGSAWTPSGGSPSSSTPTGALRGVAAFSWDGTTWQPAGQAGPDVSTPFGVLQGVAVFNWTGSAWAAASALPPGASLSLNFMTPGTLDPRITFTRASTGTYFDSTGTMQTAAVNQPRWDYDPVSLQLRGLLLEDQRTNIAFPSGNLAAAPWAPVGIGGGTVPTVVANAAMAPDGTTTATRINYPATAAGVSSVNNNLTMTAAGYACSIHARGVVGGETIWLSITQNATLYYRVRMQLTTQWQRFSFATGTLTAQVWALILGVDLRDGSGGQTPQPAQSVYVWGAQVELGDHATSLIPTTSAAVVRNIDSCLISPANMGFFTGSPGGSWFAEFDYLDATPTNGRIIGRPDTASGAGALLVNASNQAGQNDTVAGMATANALAANSVMKAATTWTAGQARASANSGAVASSAALTTGYATYATSGVRFMSVGAALSADNASGHIRRVAYWPRVLSDAEMQQVTT